MAERGDVEIKWRGGCIPAGGDVMSKGRDTGINVSTSEDREETNGCEREVGSVVWQRGWTAEMRSLHLRQHRWDLWKVLEFMQVLHSCIP